MIGEIGGNEEQQGGEFIAHQRRKGRAKPVAAFIAGVAAPPGKRMGHAGAITSGTADTATAKIEILKSYDILVAETPAVLGETMLKALKS